MPDDGGLGSHLIGDKISVGERNLHIVDMIGEGGFSYVYLVDVQDANGNEEPQMVLKVTSIHNRSQREIAEKEAKLLSRLSHPSIIKMYDTCYLSVAHISKKKEDAGTKKDRPQHLILLEHCEGGHALDVCNKLAVSGQKFDLSTLIIAFGQICNAVSYLHAQRPPIIHRDLKPVNFLVKNGAYKLCDFGSAVFGHVDLKSASARSAAEEVIQKTTTQMFRAPEMVDLYMAKKLTQATDVWALGCCLYSLAFLKNCFEEGSNLAILSGKYSIPDDNPYGEGLVDLLDRMLTADSKARADMTEVILCLSAVYSGRPLPPRKKKKSSSTPAQAETKVETKEAEDAEAKRIGTFRTDGQGVQEAVYDPTKATSGKKLASNSVAARRKRAAASAAAAPASPSADRKAAQPADSADFAFSADFSAIQAENLFGADAFDNTKTEADSAFAATFDSTAFDSGFDQNLSEEKKEKSRKSSKTKVTDLAEGMDGLEVEESSEKKERRQRSNKPSGKLRRKPGRTKSNVDAPDKKGVKKTNSFSTMFNRKEGEK
eukprot:scaffold1525_cov142-Cylindrotheca_fusiformis.AAC.78